MLKKVLGFISNWKITFFTSQWQRANYSYVHVCWHRSLDARRCPRPGRTRRLNGHQLTPPPRMTIRERLRQSISAAFYRHGLLCASYPVPIILFTSCQHPDLLVSLQSWYLIQAGSNGVGARFKLIRNTMAARPRFWWALSMLKCFMYFCGLGKAAYL